MNNKSTQQGAELLDNSHLALLSKNKLGRDETINIIFETPEGINERTAILQMLGQESGLIMNHPDRVAIVRADAQRIKNQQKIAI
jgi:hypothetical protein